MNRRGFLTLLSAVAASAALPVPDFVLSEPEILVPNMPIALGGIRALSRYDINYDLTYVRLDAYNGRDQFSVDFRVPWAINIRAEYLKNRRIAEQVLREHLIASGWLASDLIALPVPRGYQEPPWMRGETHARLAA